MLLFYVLSGFLMAHLYLGRPFDAGGVRSYTLSRASRVLPLFYVAVIGGCVLLAAFGHSGYAFSSAREILSNALLIRGTGVLWSIPVEIHFYGFFVLLWFAASIGRLGVASAVLLGACAAIGSAAWTSSSEHRWVVYYAHVFLAGCAMARVYGASPHAFAAAGRHPVGRAVAWLLLASFPLAIPGVRQALGQPQLPLFLDPVAIGYPIAVLGAALAAAGPFRALATAPLRWLGGISYSLYLLHMPLILLLIGIGVQDALPGGLAAAAVLAACIFVAWLSARMIERPAQDWLKTRLAPARADAVTHPSTVPATGGQGAPTR